MPSGLASASSITSALKGIHLPATKEQIVTYAREHTDNDTILAVLEFFPEGNYESAADIAKGISRASREIKGTTPKSSASEITSSIKGIEFPVTRAQLAQQARANGAPDAIVSLLENLPDKEYRNAVDISKGIHEFKANAATHILERARAAQAKAK